MKKLVPTFAAAAITGGIVAGIYFVFSAVVEQLQDFIWFTFFDTEDSKILAIPVAVIGAVILGGVLRVMHANGHQEIGHTIAGYGARASELNARWIVRALVIGITSLVAGASLGPEAILLPVSYAVAYLVAKKLGVEQPKQFGIIGVVVLLASFFNAYAAALVPLAFLSYKKAKDIKKSLIVVVVGLVAIAVGLGVLRLLHEREGYVYISPIGDVTLTPVLIGAAIGISAVATALPLLLDMTITPLRKIFNRLNVNWVVGSVVAGLGVGGMYFLLGPLAYFSGHSEIGDLLQQNSELTSLQLAGLAIGKIVVTAWSVATIYRGGVVFPQLLVGMSVALLLSGGIPDSSWLLTLLVASFYGIFTGALGSLIIAAAFVGSLFGVVAVPLIIAAAIGSVIVKLLFRKQFATKSAL